jgi:hypothetical protein
MTIGSTPTLSDIKTEYGGGTPPSNLRSYVRGGGYVASHSNNLSISTNPSALTIRQYIGGSSNFDSSAGTTWTGGQGTSGTYSSTTSNFGGPVYHSYYYTAFGVSTTSFASSQFSGQGISSGFGTIGSYSTVGTSKSGSGSTSIIAVYDLWKVDTAPSSVTTLLNTSIAFSGDVTTSTLGNWWTSVTVFGVTRTRASSTSNSYNSGGNYTVYEFPLGSGVYTPWKAFNGWTGNFNVSLTL